MGGAGPGPRGLPSSPHLPSYLDQRTGAGEQPEGAESRQSGHSSCLLGGEGSCGGWAGGPPPAPPPCPLLPHTVFARPSISFKNVCNDNFGDNFLKFQLYSRIKPKPSYLSIVRKVYTIVRNKGECQ